MKLKFVVAAVAAFSFLCLALTNISTPYNTEAAAYYDAHLDTVLQQLRAFKLCTDSSRNVQLYRQHFLACRNEYKKIEFFVEHFDGATQKAINGPDLVQIEEENQQDTLKPHGFQHVETMLYAATPDTTLLGYELLLLIQNAAHLRNDAGHQNYFTNGNVWAALRGGVYRIVSLGITGFDVPLCLNALPEAETELKAINKVTSFYTRDIKHLNGLPLTAGRQYFSAAIRYLQQHHNFNTFNRMTFVRQYVNPLSAWLMQCNKSLGYINRNELTPLNPYAAGLFANNIFNIDFFSPNENYRPTACRVALGKLLFYDTRLSGNGRRSCGSCHEPGKAFTDGLTKPRSLAGDTDLLRNTPTLWYSAYQKRQFYDSRTEVLEYQLSDVLHNAQEMGGSLDAAIPVLYADTAYRRLFARAYAHDKGQVSQYNIANAISSYVRSLTGFNSRFDQYIRNEPVHLTASEIRGFNLFMGKARCATCHYAPVFNGLVPPRYNETESEILAVPAHAGGSMLDADEGKYRYTRIPLHKYAFKTPTVRNAALTGPYMHNGVYRTLTEVVDFYDKGGGAGYGISLATQTLPADSLGLTRQEKTDIIAFLGSLTYTGATVPVRGVKGK